MTPECTGNFFGAFNRDKMPDFIAQTRPVNNSLIRVNMLSFSAGRACSKNNHREIFRNGCAVIVEKN